MGLVIHGRYRRYVRRDVRDDWALPSQPNGPRPAYRPISDGGERATRRAGTARLHGKRTRLAPSWLPARQPRTGPAHRWPPITGAARPWRRTTRIALIPAVITTGASSSASPIRNGSFWCR